MTHSFDTQIAEKVGLTKAIFLNYFGYWHERNSANKHHLHDDYVWTYNSVSAFTNTFCYLTPKQIRLVLEKLEDEGWIKTGNYNKIAIDRTKWYALTQKACSLLSLRFDQKGKPLVADGKPIPLSDNYIDTLIETTRAREEKKDEWDEQRSFDDGTGQMHPVVTKEQNERYLRSVEEFKGLPKGTMK